MIPAMKSSLKATHIIKGNSKEVSQPGERLPEHIGKDSDRSLGHAQLTNCLSIMAASSKFITDAIKYCTSDLLDSQDQSSIIHNYFSSIILVIMLMF